jgi:hypothetical protein
MTVEEQLRAAGRAVREQVRELPPLDLPAQPVARRARARTFLRRPGAGRWLIPVAAAAAVVAVAVTLVAVKNPPRATHDASAGRVASRSTEAAASSSAGSAVTSLVDPEALPRYFVAISGLEIMGPISAGQSGPAKAPKPDSVMVGETLTGQRLATISPPAGSTFAGVTGAADDRTFVLDSVQLVAGTPFLSATQPRTWYLLRIRPGATPVQTLTPLHFPVPDGADVIGISLSPDGSKLAVFYQVAAGNDAGFPYSGPFTLAIYSVAAGAVLRSWTGTDRYHGSYGYGSDGLPDPNSNLTWTSDGQRLAFAYRSSKSPNSSLYLREVNLAGQGGDLFADSAVVATIAVSTTNGRSKIWCDTLGITGDGRSAVCGAELPKAPPVGATLDALTESDPWLGCAAPTDTVYPGLVKISLAGDRLAQVLYQVKPKCMGGGSAAILWSSPSGGTVLGTVWYTDDPSMTVHRAIVLYNHGILTTINWAGAASPLVANETAF